MVGRDIVVVGGSAGSIEAVSELVRGLPADFPGSVFVVVHFPGSSPSTLPRILSRAGPLPARHASDGEAIEPGRIYVAPPDCHLLLSDGHVRLTRGPKENGLRPAVDPLFPTAAHSYGPRVVRDSPIRQPERWNGWITYDQAVGWAGAGAESAEPSS